MNPKNAKNFLTLFQHHIAKQYTGNPEEFAAKLEVSRATLYRFIADLRDEGIEVRYRRNSNSFYFPSPTQVELVIQAFEESTEKEIFQKGERCFQDKLSNNKTLNKNGYRI
ncbi:MAG: HTH domain-containing protein [Bacteroidales bacterium]|nr:MAG: HTH domain-containing protein [Bacteroidales bacterium]